jgi:hypothetical protein
MYGASSCCILTTLQGILPISDHSSLGEGSCRSAFRGIQVSRVGRWAWISYSFESIASLPNVSFPYPFVRVSDDHPLYRCDVVFLDNWFQSLCV